MKAFVASALLVFSASSAFATSPELLKSCTALVKFPGANEKIAEESMKIEFLKSGEATIARVTKASGSMDDEGTVSEHSIRENIKDVTMENVDEFDLNLGEQLISHAMHVTTDEVLKGFMTVDFDLSLARSVKVFLIGKPTNMGAAAVVEAKDASGKVLGSFLGGFLVAPCK